MKEMGNTKGEGRTHFSPAYPFDRRKGFAGVGLGGVSNGLREGREAKD